MDAQEAYLIKNFGSLPRLLKFLSASYLLTFKFAQGGGDAALKTVPNGVRRLAKSYLLAFSTR
jgi:hypothetical protein